VDLIEATQLIEVEIIFLKITFDLLLFLFSLTIFMDGLKPAEVSRIINFLSQ